MGHFGICRRRCSRASEPQDCWVKWRTEEHKLGTEHWHRPDANTWTVINLPAGKWGTDIPVCVSCSIDSALFRVFSRNRNKRILFRCAGDCGGSSFLLPLSRSRRLNLHPRLFSSAFSVLVPVVLVRATINPSKVRKFQFYRQNLRVRDKCDGIIMEKREMRNLLWRRMMVLQFFCQIPLKTELSRPIGWLEEKSAVPPFRQFSGLFNWYCNVCLLVVWWRHWLNRRCSAIKRKHNALTL